jgi:integration host factor subunit alpha
MGNSRYCLTKADLADAIYAALPLDKQKAAQIVEDYVEIIKNALEGEGKVMLSGFGSYEVKYKPPRRGRNPQTGESIILRARKVVKFKPSQLLRKAINGQLTQQELNSHDEAEALASSSSSGSATEF